MRYEISKQRNQKSGSGAWLIIHRPLYVTAIMIWHLEGEVSPIGPIIYDDLDVTSDSEDHNEGQ